jgi:hypothetical protein
MASTTVTTATRADGLTAATPYLVAAAAYCLVLAIGDSLLNDPDIYWHIATGQKILASGWPHVDLYSFTFAGSHWIAKEWLSQVILALADDAGGWTGVVALSVAAVALALGLLARFLLERLAPLPALALAAVAFMLLAPHATARPHLIALPIMVAWTAGLARAADGQRLPSLWLLPLMTLWANLHGGFILGLVFVAAFACDAVMAVPAARRGAVAFGWGRFGMAAFAACCLTPYGAEPLLVAIRILGLGPALSLVGEWQPADFSHLSGLELALLLGGGLILWRGLILPPVRILILAGLIHLALSAARDGEVLGLLAPIVIAAPLARQHASLHGQPAPFGAAAAALVAAVATAIVPATAGLAKIETYAPSPRTSPAAAVAALKVAGAKRILNDYDFGGYLIAAGVPTFIDGRTELYGGDFLIRYVDALKLADPAGLAAMLDEFRIDATLLAPGIPAVAWLDHDPGWKRIYADGTAIAHVRIKLRPTLL